MTVTTGTGSVGAATPMYAADTIAAVATPPGRGGVGIIRISGPLCSEIAGAVFSRSHRSGDWDSHRLYHGRIVDERGSVLDEALAVLMRRPRSYTGEDVLELHAHGSPVALRQTLARVLRCGARLAEPGEFTRRAFLNGRLDLTQAEAVIDLIGARTAAGAELAAEQLSGRLSADLAELRTHLIRLQALLEAQIDFSEEDVEVNAGELLAISDRCLAAARTLTDTYRQGKIVREGLRVAIIGAPNVGKSSLLNALLGDDRAIVTPIPGTTRDTIDETADFEGVPVLLSDTAGLRELNTADIVEHLGMQRTAAKLATAQVVLVVLDSSRPLGPQDNAVLQAVGEVPHILVLNKTDLEARIAKESVHAAANGSTVVAVSAKERWGLGKLRNTVVSCATQGPHAEQKGPVLTNMRHYDALMKAQDSLQLARQSICEQRPPELVAVDVRDALDRIGEITGSITAEDVLDKIFGEFCIGK